MEDLSNHVILAVPAQKHRRVLANITRFDKWPNAQKVKCDICHDYCWIGPRQWSVSQAHPEIPIYCLACRIPNPAGTFAHLGSDWSAIHVGRND
jgi:hypothetical protein